MTGGGGLLPQITLNTDVHRWDETRARTLTLCIICVVVEEDGGVWAVGCGVTAGIERAQSRRVSRTIQM